MEILARIATYPGAGVKARPQLGRVAALAVVAVLVGLGGPGCMVHQRDRPGAAWIYYPDRVVYSERGSEPRPMSRGEAGVPARDVEVDGGDDDGERDYRPAKASAEKPRRAAKPVKNEKVNVEKKSSRRAVGKVDKPAMKRAKD